MDDKQIMVSLGDPRIKDISEVIGNKSCNKILDYLASKEATVTEISRDLKIPINTADYNVKKLMKAGLIEKADSFWSVKGKKMPSYRLSNKKIIISPKSFSSKAFLWSLGITGLAALGLKSFMNNDSLDVVQNAAYDAPQAGLMMAAKAPELSLATPVVQNPNLFSGISSWTWFLIGAWVAILIYMAFTIFNKREVNR